MTCSFEFRRHSIKDGCTRGVIGPRGFALAREVGRSQLRGRGFTKFYASSLWRTHQSLAAFDEGAGDFRLHDVPQNAPFHLDWPELPGLWRTCDEADKRGVDMVEAALASDRKLTERTAKEVARRFRIWASIMPDGANILVVGHSPYMEFIPLGLLGLQLDSLKECQGFRLSCLGECYGLDVESPDLDPVDLRRALLID